MTTAEVARAANCSAQYVTNQRRAGIITATSGRRQPDGSIWHYPPEAVQAVIASKSTCKVLGERIWGRWRCAGPWPLWERDTPLSP